MLACAVYVADTIETQEGYTGAMNVIALRYAMIGDVERAATLADIIEDPFTRDHTYAEIAKKAEELGEYEFAQELIDSVEDYSFKTLAIGNIAVYAAEKGDFEKAIEIANGMDDSSSTIAEIALRMADTGEFSSAKELISSIEYAGSRAYAYNELASKHLKEGRKEEASNALMTALAAIDRVEFPEDEASLLIESANKYHEAGNDEKILSLLEKAYMICEKLDEGDSRDNLLSHLSIAFARIGKFENANECLDEINDPMQAVSCLIGVANEYKQAGEKEKALELFDEAYQMATGADLFLARSVTQRDNLLSNLTLHYAAIDENEKAIDTAKMIEADDSRRFALTELAAFYTRSNKIEEVRAAVDEIDEDFSRCFCLMRLSDILWAAENRDEALKFLDEAKTLAQEIRHNYQKAIALSEVSERYRLKEFESEADEFLSQSVQLSHDVKDRYEMAVLLSHLFAKYDSAGKEIGDGEKEVLQQIVAKL